MDTVSLFGAGFIGTHYAEKYPTYIVPRDNYDGGLTGSALYMRSTVHNYHPKDGEPFKDVETNLIHFLEVLTSWDDYCRESNTEFVFNLVSTWFVYSPNKIPAREDSYCEPNGFYSITALCREQLLRSYCETFGLKYRILRLANVIGIGDKKISRKKNALQHIIRELAQGRDVDYLYKGGAVRDYIDVRDCVDAIHLVLEKGNLNEIYNIGNGQGWNVNDLVEVAHRESGYVSKITMIDTPDFHKVVQMPKMYLDTKKLKSLGYVQKHDIRQTVRELVHHYQDAKEN